MTRLKPKQWMIALILLAGITLVVRSGILSGKSQINEVDTAISIKVFPVEYADIVPSLDLNGSVEGQTSATVSAKISGRIEQVLVQEGEEVKAGTPLVKMESVELANAVRQAEDSVRKAKISYELALSDFNRYQMLFDNGAVSEQQLDNAKAKLKTADADLSSAVASQSSAAQQYSYGLITSPVDGVIANKTATIGQVVSPGAALMVVQDINQVYAVINVEQKDLGRVQIGQKANVTVDAYPGSVFSGIVEVMNPEAGAVSRTFRTKIKLDNTDGSLKAGMFANVQVLTGDSVQVLTVPQQAVVQKQGSYYVFVVEDDKAIRRQIEIGQVDGSTIAVTSGLQAGEQVIASSVNRMKDGAVVRVSQIE